MRRLAGWIGGAVGGLAAYRLLLRRRPQVAPESAPTDSGARAEELREKLAESRAAEPVVEEPPAAEPVASEAQAAEPEPPEERRRQVHEEGRAALDDMRPE
jgi:hypothetical protein